MANEGVDQLFRQARVVFFRGDDPRTISFGCLVIFWMSFGGWRWWCERIVFKFDLWIRTSICSAKDAGLAMPASRRAFLPLFTGPASFSPLTHSAKIQALVKSACAFSAHMNSSVRLLCNGLPNRYRRVALLIVAHAAGPWA